jgi:hypothetical protein
MSISSLDVVSTPQLRGTSPTVHQLLFRKYKSHNGLSSTLAPVALGPCLAGWKPTPVRRISALTSRRGLGFRKPQPPSMLQRGSVGARDRRPKRHARADSRGFRVGGGKVRTPAVDLLRPQEYRAKRSGWDPMDLLGPVHSQTGRRSRSWSYPERKRETI